MSSAAPFNRPTALPCSRKLAPRPCNQFPELEGPHLVRLSRSRPGQEMSRVSAPVLMSSFQTARESPHLGRPCSWEMECSARFQGVRLHNRGMRNRRTRPPLHAYVCPKCGRRHGTIGGVVYHHCPKNRDKPTRFFRQQPDPSASQLAASTSPP